MAKNNEAKMKSKIINHESQITIPLAALNRRRFLKAAGCTLALSPLGCKTLSGHSAKVYKNNALLGTDSEVSITPNEAWREKNGIYTITVKLGEGGLPVDDSLGIVNGSLMDRWQFTFPSHFWGGRQPWHTSGDGPGSIHVKCSRPGVKVSVKSGEPLPKGQDNKPSHFVRALKNRKRAVLEISSSKDLQKGDIITIEWRDVKAPPYAMRYLFMPFLFSKLPELDRDLPIRRGEFDDLPRIRVKGHTAVNLHVTCRPMQSINNRFSLNIAAIDQYGNPAEDFTDNVRLDADKSISIPRTIIFAPEDRGCKRIEGIQGSKVGWFKIKASTASVAGKSNYIVISDQMPDNSLYFGDMHTHTLDCDGTNDIREHLDYAPKVAGLDFGAISCHAEYFGCAAAWQRYLKEIAKANQPGKFVCFPGYEWAQQGHTNAYFLSEDEAVLIWGEKRMKAGGTPPDEPPFRTGAKDEREFMQKLKALKQPVFAIAHVHTAYSAGIDDSMLWLDEIYSCHRYDRTKRENRLRNNLQRGLRLGVVAGSDMHRLTMGHLCKQPGELWPQGGWESCQFQTAGLQATFASELTRKGLYDGMQARHTYGTSGARIVLLFSCDANPMGSQMKMASDKKPEFVIEAGGTAPLSEIALCRYNGKEWSEPLKKVINNSDFATVKWSDKDFSQTGIYYVRVTQTDGEQAWSSPVWITS